MRIQKHYFLGEVCIYRPVSLWDEPLGSASTCHSECVMERVQFFLQRMDVRIDLHHRCRQRNQWNRKLRHLQVNLQHSCCHHQIQQNSLLCTAIYLINSGIVIIILVNVHYSRHQFHLANLPNLPKFPDISTDLFFGDLLCLNCNHFKCKLLGNFWCKNWI